MAITQLIAYKGNPIFVNEDEKTRLEYFAMKALIVANAEYFGTVTLNAKDVHVEIRGETKIVNERVKYPKNADYEWLAQTLLNLTIIARNKEARRVDYRLHGFIDAVERMMKTLDVVVTLDDERGELIATYKNGELRAGNLRDVVCQATKDRVNALVKKSNDAQELKRLRELAKKHNLL